TELLDDPARREALGAAAIPRADEFTWARAASVHIEAFRAAARS
ncbi:MAG: glycosyltransferase family 1 protein, partial [Actinomyces sp.]|nr:glycosyltransferase family 1 protein [Actinomyces sp.]